MYSTKNLIVVPVEERWESSEKWDRRVAAEAK